jgi:hypothetical protein
MRDGALFSIKAKERAMNPKPAVQSKSGGLRGHDKQEGALRDQNSGQGVVRDERGQDQPKDKERAQRTAGQQAQKDAAIRQPPSAGEPAGGE